MASLESKIKVKLPETLISFEEEEAYLLREFSVGRVDNADDVPSDEDCMGIFELEIERQERKAK